MEEIKTFNDKVSNIKTDIATPLKIAVFTVCATISTKIDLQKLYDYRHLRNLWAFKYKPQDKKNIVPEIISRDNKEKNKELDNTFYNSIKISFTYNDSNISCKVFPNGKLHVAGSRTIEIAHEIPNLLYLFIKEIEPISCPIIDQKIVMIKTNFSFNKKINQELLKNIINEKYRYDGSSGFFRLATFYPEQFPGINIKFWSLRTRSYYKNKFTETNSKSNKIPTNKIDGQLSIFIFRSGKVSITAANINDLAESYFCITDIVRRHNEVLIN